AVFGAPAPIADPATAVLASARDLARALPELVPDCQAGIGVSYGEVVAGYVGSATRFEYTVIGDAVNEAARLCEMAKEHPTRVLASEAALRVAADPEEERWTTGGTVELRGRSTPTTLAWPAASPPGHVEPGPG
ncbi:MAG: adenylate/guanylate cyclase domain-containing protein, partial [Dietzia cercidiphylli]